MNTTTPLSRATIESTTALYCDLHLLFMLTQYLYACRLDTGKDNTGVCRLPKTQECVDVLVLYREIANPSAVRTLSHTHLFKHLFKQEKYQPHITLVPLLLLLFLMW